MDFPGARMLVLVRQQHWDDDGTFEEEYRYFVTSLDTTLFTFKQLLRLVRVHWGIENRHHWTLDMVLGEDEHQPCRPTRTALEVVAWLRAMAFNLLSFSRGVGTSMRTAPRQPRPRAQGGDSPHCCLRARRPSLRAWPPQPSLPTAPTQSGGALSRHSSLSWGAFTQLRSPDNASDLAGYPEGDSPLEVAQYEIHTLHT